VDGSDQVLDGLVTFPPVLLPNASQVYQVQSQPQIVAAGQQVAYSRGVTNFNQMVAAWVDLGFILNQGTSRYPYFVEKERNTAFVAQGVALGSK
jgi:hypothetical protein